LPSPPTVVAATKKTPPPRRSGPRDGVGDVAETKVAGAADRLRPVPAVPETLRAVLEHARARGEDFADAWSPGTIVALAQATCAADRSDWRYALSTTEHAWAKAYDRGPVDRGERALHALVPYGARRPVMS
jgi:hypothetical protein